MSITDELRHFANEWDWLDYRADESARRLRAIADRIDAAHEEALSQAYMDVSDSRWLRLPKDIDGKPIDEHDKVDWRDHSGAWHENATVVAVCNDGCYVMYGLVFHVHKSDIRHHHAPTVKDILREFAQRWDDHMRYDKDELVEQYTLKFRLADDGKEQ